MEVAIGQLVDNKYRIVRLLGQGGMGTVYEGENVRIHHRVAIKVLHPGIATNDAALERFEREAQAAGKIGSDHIVVVYDLGELSNGARYMVMEFLDGENLADRLARGGRMAAQTSAPLMVQFLEGLDAAHNAGIVHRDLKPENVFLVRSKTGHDFVKIVDFGVSKFRLLPHEAMKMTRTGAVIGTPYYMSPEQAKGAKNSDHRSDLYSAGVVLFECTTGRVPFEAETFNELMFKIVLEPQPDPEQLVPGLDPRFAAIVRKAMAREQNARYQTAQEFRQAILEWMGSVGMFTGNSQHGGSAYSASGVQSGLQPQYPSHPSMPRAMSRDGVGSQVGFTPALTGQIGQGTPRPATPQPGTPYPGASGDSLTNLAASAHPTNSRTRGVAIGLAIGVIALITIVGIAVTKFATRHSKGVAATTTESAGLGNGTPPPPPMPTTQLGSTPSSDVARNPTATTSAGSTDAMSAAASSTPLLSSSATTTNAGKSGTHSSGGHTHGQAGRPGEESPSTSETEQVKGRTIHTEL